MRTARVLGVGWLLHFKMLSRSSFDGVLGVLWPMFFATVAFFMFRAGGSSQTLVVASLGAAVMGVWSATSVSSSSTLQRQRWGGTLELLVAAPTHFSLALLPMTIATTSIGLYCMGATLLWGRLAFGVHVPMDNPLAFVVAVVVTIVAVGMLGFLMAVAFARFRTAWALGNVLEYPVWLIGGFLVPVAALPGWVRPVSWALAPTWGMNAIREASLGGSPWPDVGIALALGLGYAAAGVLVTERVLRSARTHATLSLT